MEIWGRCAACDRWYHCRQGPTGWSCPQCGTDPVAIENRAHPQFGVRRELVSVPVAALR